MKIKFRLAAFRELRTAPDVQADLMRRAEAVATAAGEGFEARALTQSKTRARVVVTPATPGAIRANSDDNVLLRALDAGS